MQAVILAGGFGTRMRPLTLTRPKPLLPVLNKPVLVHIIDKLPKEIDEVILATNYKTELIEEFFLDEPATVPVRIVTEPEPLGTAGAVKNCRRFLKGTTLVLNCDILDSLDLTKFIRYHREKRGAATISLWQVEDPSHYGAVSYANGRIDRFVEKPAPGEAPSNLVNAGTYLLEPSVLDYIPEGKMVSLEREVYPQVIADGKGLFGYPFTGHWLDAGRLDSYLATHAALLGERGVAVGHSVKMDQARAKPWAAIGAKTKIGRGSEVEKSVIFRRCQIGEGVTITGSILGEGCSIGDGATLQDCVLGDGSIVRPKSVLKKVTMQPGESK
jgi:mannose-1-phosphate guanylyltransferase